MSGIDLEILEGVVIGRGDSGGSGRERVPEGSRWESIREGSRRLREEPFTMRLPQVEELGAVLGEVLFPGSVGTLVASLLGAGGLVEVRLVVDDPVMASLPWEVVTFQGMTLSMLPRVSFWRRPPGVLFGTRKGGEVSAALLVVPENKDLDTTLECSAVEGSLKAAGVTVTVLSGPVTVEEVGRALDSGRYQIVHYIGHGEADGIVLYDVRHQRVTASFAQLRAMFSVQDSLSLVVLNACWTGAVSGTLPGGALASSATGIVASGVPAAIAMQYPIMDSLAATFGESLYRSLMGGASIGQAVSAARRSCFVSAPDNRSWCAPVLYSHLRQDLAFAPKVVVTDNDVYSGPYSHDSIDSIISSLKALRQQAATWQLRLDAVASAVATSGVSPQYAVDAAAARQAHDEVMEEIDERVLALRSHMVRLRSRLPSLEERQSRIEVERRRLITTGAYVPFSLDRDLADARKAVLAGRRQLDEGEAALR